MAYLRTPDPNSYVLCGVAGLAFGIIGLFRRNLVAWWAMTFAFVILSISVGSSSVELLEKYGFRLHRSLLAVHAFSLALVAGFGLLLSVRIRGAYTGPVTPFWEEMPALRRIVAIVAPPLFVMAAIFSIGAVALVQGRRYANDRILMVSLKTITSAEADFRANDRDGNHINDYWTADVQGLWGVVPSDGNAPIKLIELSVALADADPVKGAYPPIPGNPTPRAAGWFTVLRQDRSENPPLRYRDLEVSKFRFGFLAFPEDFVTGGPFAFIVNDQNTIYMRRLKDDVCPSGKTPPGPVSTPGFMDWPSDAELKADWEKWD
jgi:hypothetical protein